MNWKLNCWKNNFWHWRSKASRCTCFYGGGTTGIELKDGIRYIGTGRNQEQGVALYRSEGQMYYNTITCLQEHLANATHPAPVTPAPVAGNIVFRVGQKHYTVNGEQVQLDTAPYIKNDRLNGAGCTYLTRTRNPKRKCGMGWKQSNSHLLEQKQEPHY
jgi:hypothetical protein